MSDITYTPYNKKSLLVHGDRKKYGEKLKEVGGRWNNRVKVEPGWTVPIEKEESLKKLILLLKKEEKFDNIKSRVKSNKDQKKYHRAVSDSDNSEESVSSSENEQSKNSSPITPPRNGKSEIQPEKSERYTPEKTKRNGKCTPPRSEKYTPDRPRSEKYTPDRPRRSEKYTPDRPRSEKYTPPIRKKKRSLLRSENISSIKTDSVDGKNRKNNTPTDKHRHERKNRKSPPNGHRKIYLSESESDYSSSENDFPSPDIPVKRKNNHELEREMKRKIQSLEKKVNDLKLERRKYKY
jgi:hypothetical protein